ncbi:hypothetical protein [Actinomadura craniellae]|uniref:hypothetical protein n=1 Tax=Actinomadura craniellae TaxID=2231787 RepID=UPI0013144584|nr:hypothetical protein [Actinomadura craniellae]
MARPGFRRRLARRGGTLIVLGTVAYMAPLFMLAVAVLAFSLGAYAVVRQG